MGIRFRVLACPVDASTGDRRRFAEDSLTYQKLPMPLGWVRADAGGHDGAVTVGSIDGVEMEGSDVWVEGEIFTADDPGITASILEDAASALFLAKKGVVGPSVDLDSFAGMPVKVGSDTEITAEDLEDPELEVEMLVTEGRMRSATLVRIPAFVETNHTMIFDEGEGEGVEDDDAEAEPDDAVDPEDELAALVAGVSGATDLPVAEREHAWDGAAAAGRVFDAYSDEDGNVDKARASRAFLWTDGDGTKRGDYKLGYADIIDGELRIVPAGVAATAGGRGVRAAKGVDQGAVEKKICSLYKTVQGKYKDYPDCPFDTKTAGKRKALKADAGPPRYPFDAFNAVTPDRLTPMTYDFERGLAFGHIAPWGVCHVGHKDACLTAPRAGDGNYRDFHVHRVETEEGTVYAGRITVGGGHAPEDPTMDAFAVRRVYDQKTTVAYVRAVEDEYGIFVCGPLTITDPNALPKVSRRLDNGPLLLEHAVSGDWRETVDGLQLLEVLALSPGLGPQSAPGFPVPAIRVAFRGEKQVCLTASLTPPLPYDDLDPMEVFRDSAERLVRESVEKFLGQAAAAAVEREELQKLLDGDASEQRAKLAQLIGD